MNEIVQSWPWYERIVFGGGLAMLLFASYQVAVISTKLDRVIHLLEIANDQSRLTRHY